MEKEFYKIVFSGSVKDVSSIFKGTEETKTFYIGVDELSRQVALKLREMKEYYERDLTKKIDREYWKTKLNIVLESRKSDRDLNEEAIKGILLGKEPEFNFVDSREMFKEINASTQLIYNDVDNYLRKLTKGEQFIDFKPYDAKLEKSKKSDKELIF